MSELTDTLKAAKALIEMGMGSSALAALDKALQSADQSQPAVSEGNAELIGAALGAIYLGCKQDAYRYLQRVLDDLSAAKEDE
jgi:hypothetical protein